MEMPSGKYEGKHVSKVAMEDPEYLRRLARLPGTDPALRAEIWEFVPLDSFTISLIAMEAPGLKVDEKG